MEGKNACVKVLVGCPTSSHKAYALADYSKAVKNLSYSNYDLLIVDNSEDSDYTQAIKDFGIPVVKGSFAEKARERIVNSRNVLRQKALDEGYDYFLSLEQDVIPPKDIIEQLLKAKKEIITGVYFSRYKGKLLPLLWKEFSEENDIMSFFTPAEIEKPQLLKVRACGLGCILISRSALEKIKFRYEEDKNCFDDMFFCKDAFNNGIPIFADTSVKCKHLISGMSWKNIKK